MKLSNCSNGMIAGIFVTLTFCLISPPGISGQTDKLGSITYTAVKGWKKTAKENIVTFSEIDKAAGKFCTITLYGVTAGTGNAKGDFAREWNSLVVKPFGAGADPKTETEMVDGWTLTASGAAVNFGGTNAVAFLTVMTGNGKTVSILGLFNDESYLPKLVAFNSGIDMDKSTLASVPPPPETTVQPSAPAASSSMHAQLLVQEFERNEIRAAETWIGKRVRVYGTVNSIKREADGRLVLTYKSSLGAYGNARCYFSSSQASRVAQLSPNIEATLEGTVRGWEGGYSGAKVFLLLDNCIVP